VVMAPLLLMWCGIVGVLWVCYVLGNKGVR
jgi:hypothetical protein